MENNLSKLEKHLPTTRISLPRSNKINRAIYTDGERYFIDYRLSANTYWFNNKEYTEVTKLVVNGNDHWHTKQNRKCEQNDPFKRS